MRAFLLDTNIWRYWFDTKADSQKYANIQKRIEELVILEQNVEQFVWQPGISVITWGEIDYGFSLNHKSHEPEFRKFIKDVNPWEIEIDRHTAKTYGELRAGLFEKYAPKKKRTKKLRPEQLIDPATSLELGIQENDLWIAAQAITLNLTLVTNDNMEHIKEIAGKSLHIDNWA